MMNRTSVIQKIIDEKSACTYLEIGVESGVNFFPIKAKRKIAIDPNFSFSKRTQEKWTFKNFYNIEAKYYQLSSDRFFENVTLLHPVDVAFIDGLHTRRQSLEDVNNVLSNLSKNGVIVMHDCNPPHEAAAYPIDSIRHTPPSDLPGWTGEWCGDVWKTICYLRSHRNDLKVFVLDCDYGLGIITRGENNSRLNLTDHDLEKMTYEDLSRDREKLLNLKDESFFEL